MQEGYLNLETLWFALIAVLACVVAGTLYWGLEAQSANIPWFGQVPLGAAYLAGLATGVYADRQAIARLWQAERTFYPTLSRERADELMARWEHAVRQACAAEQLQARTKESTARTDRSGPGQSTHIEQAPRGTTAVPIRSDSKMRRASHAARPSK